MVKEQVYSTKLRNLEELKRRIHKVLTFIQQDFHINQKMRLMVDVEKLVASVGAHF